MSVQAMKRGYGYVYVCVIINQISSRQLLVCEYMYMYANTAERLRLHKQLSYY